jgi:FGGY-family pentulose kinase
VGVRELAIGVDVGTSSARAGVLDMRGRLLGLAECGVAVRREGPDLAEQDSEDIWRGVCAAVRAAMADSGADPAAVAAVGFDATCSLVFRTADGAPLPLGGAGPGWDTIQWMDHRAAAEAAEIGAARPELAALNGGAVSPEAQAPKLLRVKRATPEVWGRAGLILDLCDFLTWRATGTPARSSCALICKWPYSGGWDPALLARIGLGDLVARTGAPSRGAPPGTDLGPLTGAAASELGLAAGTRAAAGLIDAHAAALGMLGRDPTGALALVAGTSSCVMAFARRAEPRPGLWGPFPDAVLPGLAVIEGGQSAAGATLDHVLCAFGGLRPDAETHAAVARRARALREIEGPHMAADLHVLPDFLGARGARPSPVAQGAISGLSLDGGFDALCRLYWRACVALAVGLREIVEAMAQAPATTLHLGGGHARSPLLSDLYAEAIGASLAIHDPRAPALRGAAATAAVAAGLHPDLFAAAAAMAGEGERIAADPARARLYDRDLMALRLMRAHRAALAAL